MTDGRLLWNKAFPLFEGEIVCQSVRELFAMHSSTAARGCRQDFSLAKDHLENCK